MKYTSSNKPLVCMQTQSTCYKGTRKMTIKGVLWHSTGANNPNLKRYVQPSDTKPSADTYSKSKWLEILGKNTNANDWNHTSIEVGLNCWIGKLADGTVTTVQTMPWEYRPWGCASGKNGSCNDGWIQFEICEDTLTDKNYFNKIYQEACEITAYLCKLYNIDPKGTVTHNGVKVPTILCHQDSYKLGLGSNHSDVLHWFSKHGKTMDNARNDVAALIGGTSGSTSNSNSGNTVTENTATTVKTYKVVTAVNKYSTAADAAAQKNAASTKLEAGTYYIYNKYPTGVNGMYNVSTDKTGNSAGSWINPSENVVKESTTTQLYRVRKSKNDAKSQVGAYSVLQNAIDACQTAGEGYHVFDNNYNIVYSYKATAVVTLTGITVTKMPTKTTYSVGETFDSTGLEVKATYSDKSTKVITGYTTTLSKSTTSGNFTVTLTFEGKTASFDIIMKNNEKETSTESTVIVAVYDLDYSDKTKIVDTSVKRTNSDCVKAIKKILANNSSFDPNIAKAFFKLAPKYNIDPMMAISQSILETGWFKYQGSAVTAAQHNYCGLGVTSTGVTGASFASIEEGVTAQLQHLFAYGCTTALPSGEKVADPRFSLVARGIAPYWQQLAGRWACPGYDKTLYDTPQKAMEAGNTYGQKILALCKTLATVSVDAAEVNKYFPSETVAESKPEQVKDPIIETPSDNKDNISDVEVESNEKTSIGNTTALVFKCIKKLVQVLANLFSKGE